MIVYKKFAACLLS